MLITSLSKLALLGASWVLYLLLALSVLSIGIMIERWWYFRAHAGNTDDLADALLNHLKAGDQRGADELLKRSSSIEAAVLLPALAWLDGGPDSFAEALDAALAKKRAEMEKGLTFLGTLGNNAPFIGLLGTVIGVIQAFHMLGNGAGTQQNQAAMGGVMSSISEALVATGVGLLVALPAVVGYNLAQKRVGQVETNVGIIAKQVLALLKADAKLVREFRLLNEDPPTRESDLPENGVKADAVDAEPAELS
ncbi:MAG TPA: MotA/TolQ/ExbB proton channel family protein [Polyangiaceae bacterium]|jgi:biopolymer transport protein ExbB/biopolymer transport protein TolQ